MTLLPIPEGFAELLATIGVPADRIDLVKENVQLRWQLTALIAAVNHIGNGLHASFQHTGLFDECQRASCAELRRICAISRP